MITHRRKLIVLTASLSLAFPAGSAEAQVFVDPGSPSDKEYGIPLEDQRCEASASCDENAPTAPGERSAPLFGEGIEPDDGNGGAGNGGGNGKNDGGSGSGSGSGDGREQREEGGTAGSLEDTLTPPQPVGATVPQGGFGSAVTIGAVALSVLLLGGVIGSIARRRSS